MFENALKFAVNLLRNGLIFRNLWFSCRKRTCSIPRAAALMAGGVTTPQITGDSHSYRRAFVRERREGRHSRLSRRSVARFPFFDFLPNFRFGQVHPLLAAFFLMGCAVNAGAQTAHFSYAQLSLGGGFTTPEGVAVDASCNVYVADPSSKETVS